MRVTTADLWEPAPGRLLRWDVTADDRGSPAALSLNQRNHLAGALAGAAPVWLAAAFDVHGPIDTAALGRALRTFAERHSSLQLEVTRGRSGPAAYRHRPASLDWSVAEVGETATVAETRAWLHRTLEEGCDPFGFPAYVPLAISRPDRSTIVLGMDHQHCDAYSMTVVVDELAELYAASCAGSDPVSLPPAACFVTAVEREQSDPVRVRHDDERLRGWHDFLRARSFELPTFPLPLGVAPGERRPQATVVRDLAAADEIGRISARARRLGISTYAAALAALATAVHDLGGPERLDLLVPVSTRADAAELRSVGWYTTTVPVSVVADLSDRGLATAGAAVRAGVRLGAVPLDQVLASLPAPLVRTRADVFMVSWMDYRHLPGGSLARQRSAHHISAPTLADDLQVWLSRTDAGLAVRVRFPDTPEAHATVAALLDGFARGLRAIGDAPAVVG